MNKAEALHILDECRLGRWKLLFFLSPIDLLRELKNVKNVILLYPCSSVEKKSLIYYDAKIEKPKLLEYITQTPSLRKLANYSGNHFWKYLGSLPRF